MGIIDNANKYDYKYYKVDFETNRWFEYDFVVYFLYSLSRVFPVSPSLSVY